MVLVAGGEVDKMFTLKVTLDDDLVRVADWLATFQQHFDETSRAAESIVEAVETDAELHAELERFRQNWPRYRERLTNCTMGSWRSDIGRYCRKS